VFAAMGVNMETAYFFKQARAPAAWPQRPRRAAAPATVLPTARRMHRAGEEPACA
jgi:hypothetical protein